GFVVHEEIIQAAQELNTDLIVMGSHGRTGVRKFVLGSVAQKVQQLKLEAEGIYLLNGKVNLKQFAWQP
ncbi:universal stress protein, partial [Acinetobacter baumannii]|uniref:universal stress protein n=1 Tax=Acinetobacter baumannii TaxID=470 RepID=UPI001CB82F9B